MRSLTRCASRPYHPLKPWLRIPSAGGSAAVLISVPAMLNSQAWRRSTTATR